MEEKIFFYVTKYAFRIVFTQLEPGHKHISSQSGLKDYFAKENKNPLN